MGKVDSPWSKKCFFNSECTSSHNIWIEHKQRVAIVLIWFSFWRVIWGIVFRCLRLPDLLRFFSDDNRIFCIYWILWNIWVQDSESEIIRAGGVSDRQGFLQLYFGKSQSTPDFLNMIIILLIMQCPRSFPSCIQILPISMMHFTKLQVLFKPPIYVLFPPFTFIRYFSLHLKRLAKLLFLYEKVLF